MNEELKFGAKGSRKTGEEFKKEILSLCDITHSIEIDFNFPHNENFEKELQFLSELKKDRGINYTVHAQYYGGSINDFNSSVRRASIDEILRNIDNADQIGAEVVTLHPALEPYGLKIPMRADIEKEAYFEIAKYAKKKHIKIGLENEAQTCFWFPDRACKFELLANTVSEIGMDNFGFTIDVGHAHVSGEDYVQAINKFGNKIFHTHVHDNFGKADINLSKCKRPDPHLVPGKGEINWRGVLDALQAIGYPNVIELECEVKEIQEGITFLKNL